jgi:hypothetical protein
MSSTRLPAVCRVGITVLTVRRRLERSIGQQDRRVIDALTAAAMVVQHSTRATPKTSVYEQRYAAA